MTNVLRTGPVVSASPAGPKSGPPGHVPGAGSRLRITYAASDSRYHFDETMALADIRNFLAVDERLGTAGQPTEAQLGDVAADGYVAVVNLGLLDPKYCLPDEAASVASLGLGYRHIPVKFDAPTVEDFRTFAATMNEWDGKKIFVHCAANYRVSTFVALYGELRLGWTRERADALMRKLWQPNDTWRAFIELCRRVQA